MTTISIPFQDSEKNPAIKQGHPLPFIPSLTLAALNLKLTSLRCPRTIRETCVRHAAWRLRGGLPLRATFKDGVARARRFMAD